MSEKLSVSVLLPVVDEWESFEETLRSVLSQRFSSFEVIVRVDGGAEFPEIDALQDSRVYLLSGERLGLAGSLNVMAQKARGSLLVRIDADDVMLPGRLEKQFQLHEKNPDALIAGKACMVNEAGQVFVSGECDETYVGFLMLTRNPLVHSATAFPKKLFDELGGYDETWKYSQDFELWTRMLEKANLVLHNDEACEHRHVLNENKMREQTNFVLPLIQRNIHPYLGEIELSIVQRLFEFSIGMDNSKNSTQFDEVSSLYFDLFSKYNKKFNSQSCAHRFLEEWPYLLGRNLRHNKLSFLQKGKVLLKNKVMLKAYSLNQLLFSK